MTTKNQELSSTNCPQCSSSDTTNLFEVEGIGISQCKSCEISFSQYDPNKSQDLYIEDYYSGTDNGYGDYASEIKTHKATFSKRLEWLEKLMPEKGVLLDYGCAIGHLCMVAKDRGWNVFGSDFSNYGVEQTKEKFGVETFVSDVTHPPVKNNSVDAVCMYDLIEHIPDPSKALRNVKDMIRPGGFIHLVTPDVGSISQKILGKNWFHFKPREHLFYFNKKTMKNLLETSGYEVISVSRSYSYMTLEDILKRFEKYVGKGPIKALTKLSALLGLNKKVVPLMVGNLEAMATPKKVHQVSENVSSLTNKQVKLKDILKCTQCEGEKLTEQFTCSSCGAFFELEDGIPNSKIEMKKAA